MISDHLQFRGFDPERVANLLDLGRPFGATARGGAAFPPGLLLLHRDGRTVKAVHSLKGRLEPDSVAATGSDLAGLAAAHAARWVVVAEVAALREAGERAAGALRPGSDSIELGLELCRSIGEEVEAGRIALWPNLAEGIKWPRRGALERALDVVLPPRSSSVLYIFDESKLHAEGICVRGDRQIEVLAGHDALEAGPPPSRWRDQHKELLEVVGRRFEPPSVGVFVSLATVESLARGEMGPKELSRALARRDLILDPLPPWLAAPLGLAAARGAAQAGRQASARLARTVDPTGLGGRLAGKVGGAVAKRLRQSKVVGKVEDTLGRVSSKVDLAEVLGFDPFKVAGRLLELWAIDGRLDFNDGDTR